MVLIYFLVTGLLKSYSYHKEILIALIYAGGVLVGPLSLSQNSLSLPEIILMVQFTLLALVNLLVFAYYESDIDRLQEFPSLLLTIGRQKSKRLIIGILLLIGMVSFISSALFLNNQVLVTSYLMILIMSVVLGLVFLFPTVFANNDRFRYVGDAIFFIPLTVI